MMSGINKKVMAVACLVTFSTAISLKMESVLDPSVLAIEGQEDLALVALEQNEIGWYNDDYYHWWNIVYVAIVLEILWTRFINSESIDPCCKLLPALFVFIRSIVLFYNRGWPAEDIFEEYDACWYCYSGTTFKLTDTWHNYSVADGGYMLFLYGQAIDVVIRLAFTCCMCGCFSTALCCMAGCAPKDFAETVSRSANAKQVQTEVERRAVQESTSAPVKVANPSNKEDPVAIEMAPLLASTNADGKVL